MVQSYSEYNYLLHYKVLQTPLFRCDWRCSFKYDINPLLVEKVRTKQSLYTPFLPARLGVTPSLWTLIWACIFVKCTVKYRHR